MTKPTAISIENYNTIEREVIYLLVTCQLIDEMVNHNLFQIFAESDEPHVQFRRRNSAQIFSIWLADFITLPRELQNSLKLSQAGKNYSDLLLEVCKNPSFCANAKPLKSAIDRLQEWLSEEMLIPDFWFSSIQLKVDIRIERQIAFYIVGNTAKHNFFKLEAVTKKLKKVIEDSARKMERGKPHPREFSLESCLKAIPDFCDRFQDDIMLYLSSELVELLNAVRWEIHRYLSDEYQRSYHQLEPHSDLPRYEFISPDCTSNPFVRHLHWNLMNMVRSGPFVEEFKCGDLFKKRFKNESED